MLKIGMVGSESTHALTFANLANLPVADGQFPFGDVRVTEIWGEDADRTYKVAENGRIPHIAAQPQEMIGKVDAVMVVPRDGGSHARYALPFVEAGIPTWVDKPFTVDYKEALLLTQAAKKSGAPLTGGSNCRFSCDVLTLKACFEKSRASGATIYSAGFNFPCDIASEYGGLYFYASHAAEILYTILGGKAVRVKTDVHCGNLVSLVKYPDFTVTINFANVSQYYGILYTSAGVVARQIDISMIYERAFADFIDVIEGRQTTDDYERLLFPVRFLNALEQSIQQGGAEVDVEQPDT